MEGLTRLVSESLARHGFDRPLDYRRLQWSRWFRCESLHSLLFVPSKPGVFAIAEEVMDLGSSTKHGGTAALDGVGTTALGCPPERSSAHVEERCFSAASETDSRRMLAVTQFFEADDMAFVLDRMLSCPNPMRDRLASGRYFVRFVLIEDQSQRRTISSALNQWMVSAAEKATGIGTYFASSLELNFEGNETEVPRACPEPSRRVSPPLRDPGISECGTGTLARDSSSGTKINRPVPFPSGF